MNYILVYVLVKITPYTCVRHVDIPTPKRQKFILKKPNQNTVLYFINHHNVSGINVPQKII